MKCIDISWNTKGEGKKFASIDDVLIALEMGEVETLTPIKLRYTGKVIDLTKASFPRRCERRLQA